MTSLRFFAAMLVVLFHARQEGMPGLMQAGTGGITGAFRDIVSVGYVSVGFFFILSGFILAYNYGARDRFEIDLRRFWMARFGRIYPVYLLSLALGSIFALNHFLKKDPLVPAALKFLGSGLSNLLMLGAWSPAFSGNWNPPSWSLSAEAFFYFCFPLLGTLVWKISGWRLVLSGVVFSLLSIAAPALVLAFDPVYGGWPAAAYAPGNPWAENDALAMTIKFNPALRLSEFVLGIALGRLFLLRRQNAKVSAWPALACLASFGLIAATLCNASRVPYGLLHNGLLDVPYAFVIFALACDRGWITRALSASWLVRLGEASYALYILHAPIKEWIIFLAKIAGYKSGLSPGIFLAVFLSCSVAASILVFLRVEEPMRTRLRSLSLGATPRNRPLASS